ncbi:hypothetical protein COO91_08810 [Nostoc flagelliforme CCNUN1]|uniref:Uncharacterized protein n=1 Tax=Nostoc flagelliforme CCNUN1 TaxID=2038116 RepID=A0A2K8T4N7_9NOSO|nr:hypothetical protein COO91_08810 [Nostoc flagelliforme CCNUN1]
MPLSQSINSQLVITAVVTEIVEKTASHLSSFGIAMNVA